MFRCGGWITARSADMGGTHALTVPGPTTRAPLPQTVEELRSAVRGLAEGRDVPYVVALWFYRAWLVGFHGGLDGARVPTAKDDALTLLALADRELAERDGWEPSRRKRGA